MRSRLGQGKKANKDVVSAADQLTPGEALEDTVPHRTDLILSEGAGMGRVHCPGLFSSHVAQGDSPGQEAALHPWPRAGEGCTERCRVKGIWARDLHSYIMSLLNTG